MIRVEIMPAVTGKSSLYRTMRSHLVCSTSIYTVYVWLFADVLHAYGSSQQQLAIHGKQVGAESSNEKARHFPFCATIRVVQFGTRSSWHSIGKRNLCASPRPPAGAPESCIKTTTGKNVAQRLAFPLPVCPLLGKGARALHLGAR